MHASRCSLPQAPCVATDGRTQGLRTSSFRRVCRGQTPVRVSGAMIRQDRLTSWDSYDLIIIGGGSGGSATAKRAAEYGAKVSMSSNFAL